MQITTLGSQSCGAGFGSGTDVEIEQVSSPSGENLVLTAKVSNNDPANDRKYRVRLMGDTGGGYTFLDGQNNFGINAGEERRLGLSHDTINELSCGTPIKVEVKELSTGNIVEAERSIDYLIPKCPSGTSVELLGAEFETTESGGPLTNSHLNAYVRGLYTSRVDTIQAKAVMTVSSVSGEFKSNTLAVGDSTSTFTVNGPRTSEAGIGTGSCPTATIYIRDDNGNNLNSKTYDLSDNENWRDGSSPC